MPFVDIPRGRLCYEEIGCGPPVVCLHGGWGRGIMPFDEAVRVLSARWRVILPDRLGYAQSSPIAELGTGYHREAMDDLRALLERLGLTSSNLAEPPVLWGHSDGAILSAYYGASFPADVSGLVLEAAHYRRRKSRDFFARFAAEPECLPDNVRERLAADHGETAWREVVSRHSRAWLALGDLDGAFYEPGLLERIGRPVLVLHGAQDIHTPVEEIHELCARLSRVEVEILTEGGHSPHSEPATAGLCARRVVRFLESLRRG